MGLNGPSSCITGVLLKRGNVHLDRHTGRAPCDEAEVGDTSLAEDHQGRQANHQQLEGAWHRLLLNLQREPGPPAPGPRASASRTGQSACWPSPGWAAPGSHVAARCSVPGALGGWRPLCAQFAPSVSHACVLHLPGVPAHNTPHLTDRHPQQGGSPEDPQTRQPLPR